MKHKKITIKCLNCGKEKEVFYSDVKRGKGKYCNRKCWDEHKRKLPEFINCKWCNKKFKNVQSQRNKKFCSRECYSKWQKGRPIPPNIQNKNGRKPRTYHLTKREKYGNAFDREWREKVFKRDNWTCQDCKTRGGRLQAHHIIPYKIKPKLRHDINNGQTLCLECHKKTDSYGWKNYWNNYIKK